MIKGMVGRKLGMTTIFNEKGEALPVTVIECGPNVVTQIRTTEKDGYDAVQMGFGISKRLNQPEKGHRNGSGFMSDALREVQVDGLEGIEIGQQFRADTFASGELVDVAANSKGRGFQGGVKRHGFAGGPKTHGQSDRLRAPGSIGSSATPGRVYKGMKMAGHMGNARVTVQNLEVVRVDVERNLLLVKGSVPGPNKGLVLVRKAIKPQQYTK